MITVNAQEFSRILHSLGLTNADSEPGILHTEHRNGFRHTVWRDKNKAHLADIQFDHINPTVHHINEQLIPDWEERVRGRKSVDE